MDFLCRVIEEVISAGCTTVNLPDTVGYSTPDEIGAFFRDRPRRASPTPATRRSARTATTISAWRSPTRWPRSRGRAPGRVHGQRHRRARRQRVARRDRDGDRACASDLLPYTTGIEPREIYPSSQMLTALTGEAVQANKAIVGRNAFAHEAGIHQDGMLKDRRTYEIMRPGGSRRAAGDARARQALGRHAVQRRCEQIGLALERHEVETVYWAIMSIADREKVVSDRDLADVIGRIRGRRRPPARRPASPTSTARPPKSATATASKRSGSPGSAGVLPGSPGSTARDSRLGTSCRTIEPDEPRRT